MTMQDWLWTADGALVGLALLAGVADWRRVRRRSIEDWGWMPWRGVQVAALFAAAGITMLLVHR
jgi:hypothetical protein